MRKPHININYSIEQWLWFAILFSLPLSIRLNSLILLISGLVFLVKSIIKPPSINTRYFLYVLPLVLYFIIQVVSNRDRLLTHESIKEIEQQLPLIIIPLFFILSKISLQKFKEAALPAILISVVFGSLIMIGDSLFLFLKEFDPVSFTYHDLSKPFDTGAIFFSFFIVVSLLRYNNIVWIYDSKRLKAIIFVFLLIMLFLLSSKLMIVVGTFMIVMKYYIGIFRYLKENRVALFALIIVFLVALYPVIQRLSKIADPHLEIVMDKKYSWDSPLNGLNLRLIQTRYGIELLNDNNAWVLGLGIDKTQILLNKKYKETGIYSGYDGSEDTGYQNYNFHNQYIETLVRSGVVGLLLLILILFMLIKTPKTRMFVGGWEVLLLILFFFTESVLERQIGIVYFCIAYAGYFPLIEKSGDNLKVP
jgi:O-antigen ligase